LPSNEHLSLLKNGVAKWNRWREANPAVEPNLMNADLRNADLSDADLSNSNLVMSDLQWANLINANLSKASLFSANLSCANLSYASLRSTVLWGTNLSNARLCGATLNDAYFGGTVMGNTDFLNAVGLDSCSHNAPSSIDIRTLARSGSLDLSFLRGCGLPESLIDLLTVIITPDRFYSCFISYSAKNKLFAVKLYTDLQNNGVRCFYAPEDLEWGAEMRTRIDESINMHDKVLLILSRQSIASKWVKKEVETAMEREDKQKRIILFPIRLDNSVMKIETGWPADIRRSRNIGNFTRWRNQTTYEKALHRLLRDLRADGQQDGSFQPI
jgi:hypothetical protein